MRVERPRIWVKLILSATLRLASIGLPWWYWFERTTYLGWQDATVEMEGRAKVMEVVGREAATATVVRGLARCIGPQRTSCSIIASFHHIPHNMSTLPRSVGSRLLPAALRPSAARVMAPKYRTYASAPSSEETESKSSSSDAPAVNLTESSQIRQENAKEAVRHKPDYNVAIDYRTSYVINAYGEAQYLMAHTGTSPRFRSG
jgi:hypothetical protein